MNTLTRKIITLFAASSLIVSGAAITAGAYMLHSDPNSISAETPDTPVQFSSSDGISPYSAEDIHFSEDITTSSFKKIGNPEEKDNDTSAYIFIGSTLYDTEPILAQIWGCKGTKNLVGGMSYSWKTNATLNSKVEEVKYVKLYIGIEYQIYNNVNESNYRYAGLQLRSTGRNCHVMGLWSPDSVNTAGMPVAD